MDIRTVTLFPSGALTSVGNTTAAYAANQQMGDLITFSDAVRETGGTGHIVGVSMVHNLQTTCSMSLMFFKASPSHTTTDRQTFSASDANMALQYLGTIDVTTTDWHIGALNNTAYVDRTRVPIQAASGSKSIFMMPIANAATSATGADISFKLAIAAD